MTDTWPRFTAPVVLDESHDLAEFSSGEPTLDDWLRGRALNNLKLGATRSYGVCAEAGSRRVIGYYALAMGGILARGVLGSMRRNMPDPIPSVILGRLAIDASCQGHGLGALLLQDAVSRSLRAAGEISARLLVVHALSPTAEAFYLHHGFTRLPGEAPTLAFDLIKLARVVRSDQG